MFNLKNGERQEIDLQIRTLVVDPEEFDGVDGEIIKILRKITEHVGDMHF